MMAEPTNIARAYEQARKFAEEAQRKKQRETQLTEQLGQLTGLQEEAFGRLTRGFRTAAETAVGQQLGGVLRGVGQTAARRGIVGSGIAAGAEAQARTQLAGQALQAQLGYRQRLGEFHEQARQGLIQRKFDFWEAMDQQMQAQEFEERMLRLRERMAQDAQGRQNMLGLGSAIGGFLGGPVGAWLGGMIGGGMPSGGIGFGATGGI